MINQMITLENDNRFNVVETSSKTVGIFLRRALIMYKDVTDSVLMQIARNENKLK